MKAKIPPLIILLAVIFVFVGAYEYKISATAGNSVSHYDIGSYRDSITYQLITMDIDDSTRYLMVNYVVGDTIVSTGKHVSGTFHMPDMGVMDTDTNGRIYAAWMDYYNDKAMVFFAQATDTVFAFTPRACVDSMVYGTGTEWLIFPDIAVSPSGENIFIVYNRYFFTDSIVDSVWTEFVFSDDFGSTFAAPQRLTTPNNYCFDPDIDADENNVYISYTMMDGGTSHILLNVVDLPFSIPTDESLHAIDTITDNCTEPALCLRNDTLYCVYKALNTAQASMNIRTAWSPAIDLATWNSMWVNPANRNQGYPELQITRNGRKFVTFLDTIPGGGPTSMLSEFDTISSDFDTDWILMLGSGADVKGRQKINYMNLNHIYIYSPIYNGGANVIYQASAKPDSAPVAPQNVRVNDTTAVLWYSDPNFNVKWTEPFDYSAIYKAFVKIGSPPANNYDTTFTTEDSFFDYIMPAEGNTPAYIWLMDYRGNLNHNNRKMAVMKFDSSAPTVPFKVDPPDKDTLFDRTINFIWRSSTDAVSGMAGYGLIIDTLVTMATAHLFLTSDTVFTVDTTMITEPFQDRRYFWGVLAGDSADNIASQATYFFDLRATQPVQLTHPQDGDSVSLPVSITWDKINGYDDNIVSYRMQLSKENAFMTLSVDSVINNNTYTLSASDAGSLFIRVRAINAKGTECLWSNVRKFYIRENLVPPDTLHLLLSADPDTIIKGNISGLTMTSNKDSITFLECYYNTQTAGDVNFSFTQDSLDAKKFYYDLSTAGMTDSTAAIFVKCEDMDGYIDSAMLTLMMYDTMDAVMSVVPEVMYPGDSAIVHLNINTPLGAITDAYYRTQTISPVAVTFIEDSLNPLHYTYTFNTAGLEIHDPYVFFHVDCENAAHSQDTVTVSVRLMDSLHISLDIDPDTVQIGESSYITIWSNYDSVEISDAYYHWGLSDTVDMSLIQDTSNPRQYNYYIPTEGMSDGEMGIFVKCISGTQQDSVSGMIYVLFPDKWFDEKQVLPWPNPATGNEVYVRMNLTNNAAIDIKLYDMKGGFINLTEADMLAGQTRDIPVDIGNLKPDLYFMLIEITNTDTGEVITIKRKFVKAS